MVMKDASRTLLKNLPEESISSWVDLGDQFVANFKATHERPLTLNHLPALRQRPGGTLRVFTQCFSETRNKIPKVYGADSRSAYCNDVTNVWMSEKLSIHDELTSPAMLFELPDKCCKAEERHLFIHNNPHANLPAPNPT
jgi:hypothetical protein